MKKIICFLFCFINILSCSKDNELRSVRNDIVGIWEYIRFSSPFFSDTLPSGNSKILVFTDEGTFQRKNHDTIIYQGKYALLKVKECSYDPGGIILKTDENAPGPLRVDVKNDTLSLSTSPCVMDGGISYYRRIK